MTIFCISEQRAKSNDLGGYVDDTQLQRLKRRYGRLLDIRVIPEDMFNRYQNVMPTAVYFDEGQSRSIYSQQISDQAQLSRQWAVDNQNDSYFPILKKLCVDNAIDCPLVSPDMRTYHHSLYLQDYWEDRSLWKTLIHVSKKSMLKSGAYKPQILSNMCASAFYLGRYAEAEGYADQGLSQAGLYIYPETHCRLLYLKSTTLRPQNRFDEAVDLCKQALAIYQERKVSNNRLLAKIYFNWLAAEMDNPNSKLNIKEIENLAEMTIAHLNKSNDHIEASRVHIRMANYYLKHNLPEKAQRQLEQVSNEVESGFTRVTGHNELAKGRLFVAQGKEQAALSCLQYSMEIAHELGASADYKRAKDEMDRLTEEPLDSVKRLFTSTK